jgi:hypothetical protein
MWHLTCSFLDLASLKVLATASSWDRPNNFCSSGLLLTYLAGSPAPPALRVARQIELMHERDIWVRPGKDDVS